MRSARAIDASMAMTLDTAYDKKLSDRDRTDKA